MDAPPERLHRTWIDSDRLVPSVFIRPVQRFFRIEAASGILMLAAALGAIVWANSPAWEGYFALWETPVLIRAGTFHLEETLGDLVNDGLMVLFFYVVGLEIKRELVLGELRDPKAASLPVLAALGGMIVPALIYLSVVAPLGEEALRGWGVPVATDIAFSVGVLSLLGRRVPTSAKLFLLALAIADDLGGIVVIALFYTSDLEPAWLAAGAAGLAVIWVGSRVGIRSHLLYLPLAAGVWFAFLESGVHATISGVAIAFLTPARPMYGLHELERRARLILDRVPALHGDERREEAEHEAMMLSDISREAVAPLRRNADRLQVWTSFLVVPIFALANAGVRFDEGIIGPLTSRVAIGVGVGLVLGKLVGISSFAWLAVRAGLGRLPRGTSWRHMTGVAATAGIGFTVALFITALAYRDPVFADQAKVGIFAGSLVAGLLGAAVLLGGPSPGSEPDLVREEEIRLEA